MADPSFAPQPWFPLSPVITVPKATRIQRRAVAAVATAASRASCGAVATHRAPGRSMKGPTKAKVWPWAEYLGGAKGGMKQRDAEE